MPPLTQPDLKLQYSRRRVSDDYCIDFYMHQIENESRQGDAVADGQLADRCYYYSL